MKLLNVLLASLLACAAVTSEAYASYQGPDGLYYQYKTTNWFKKVLAGNSGTNSSGSWSSSDINTYSGVVIEGSSGVEDFSETWALHFVDTAPGYYKHADDVLTFTPEENRHRIRDYERNGSTVTLYSPADQVSSGSLSGEGIPVITTGMGTTVTVPGGVSIVTDAPTAPVIPLTGPYYVYQFWGMVTWSNIAPSPSAASGGSDDHFDDNPDESSWISPSPTAIFSVNGGVISNGGSYPGGGAWDYEFRAASNVPLGGLVSTWKCTSAVSNITGLPISSSTYSITGVVGGADFTATECGTYEFDLVTMFKTTHFTLFVGHPEISEIDFGVTLQATQDQVGYGVELSTGVHRFEALLLDAVFGDYGIKIDYDWSVGTSGGGSSGISSQVLDENGNPDPHGSILEVTVTAPGLYEVSVFATCEAIPSIEGYKGFDILVP